MQAPFWLNRRPGRTSRVLHWFGLIWHAELMDQCDSSDQMLLSDWLGCFLYGCLSQSKFNQVLFEALLRIDSDAWIGSIFQIASVPDSNIRIESDPICPPKQAEQYHCSCFWLLVCVRQKVQVCVLYKQRQHSEKGALFELLLGINQLGPKRPECKY